MLDYSVKLHTKEPADLLTIGAAWGEEDQQLPCQGTWGHIGMEHEMGSVLPALLFQAPLVLSTQLWAGG